MIHNGGCQRIGVLGKNKKKKKKKLARTTQQCCGEVRVLLHLLEFSSVLQVR